MNDLGDHIGKKIEIGSNFMSLDNDEYCMLKWMEKLSEWKICHI